MKTFGLLPLALLVAMLSNATVASALAYCNQAKIGVIVSNVAYRAMQGASSTDACCLVKFGHSAARLSSQQDNLFTHRPSHTSP